MRRSFAELGLSIPGAECRGLPRRRREQNINTVLGGTVPPIRLWTDAEIIKQENMIVASTERALDFSTVENIATERRLAEAKNVVFYSGFALLTHRLPEAGLPQTNGEEGGGNGHVAQVGEPPAPQPVRPGGNILVYNGSGR